MKAAETSGKRICQNPLGWLTPALGTVDALTPINADPPNLHDQVCGPHRKRPAAEDEEWTPPRRRKRRWREHAVLGAAFKFARADAEGRCALRTIPVRSCRPWSIPGRPERLRRSPTSAPSKRTVLGARKSCPGRRGREAGRRKAADAKAGDGSGADGKATGGKANARAHWTPTSSSALSTSPPPGLETKRLPPRRRKSRTRPSRRSRRQAGRGSSGRSCRRALAAFFQCRRRGNQNNIMAADGRRWLR